MLLPSYPLILSSMLWNLVPVVPNPVDAHGWSLRVRGHILASPYFVGEVPDWHKFEILLVNTSKATRTVDSLFDAFRYENLTVEMTDPKREIVRRNFEPNPRALTDVRIQLKPGERESAKFTLGDFGFWHFRKAGEYQAQAVLKTPQGRIASPPWRFRVVDIPDKNMLDTQTITLAGFRARRPTEMQERITVQQVKWNNRIYLLYRKLLSPSLGGGVNSTIRLGELPAQVKMTVEGEYGDKRSPITIRYKDPNSPTETKTLVIDSISGRPWKDFKKR